jgi:5-methyltetrahydropteroyltriglutamate--homocysteine methyltransferase
MERTTPPFRADHVGSLLRPAALKEARAQHAQGKIPASQLKEIEDREIERVIRKQEEIGLKLATDGELKQHAHVTPKMTIPAPGVLHFRQGRVSISKDVYPDLDAFFADLTEAYRKTILAFYEAGCRYLQLDDTTWAMMCDDGERQHSRERGDRPETLPGIYARMINDAIKDRPDDMVVTMHSCRGNFRSTWIARGGYEPVAETLFGQVDVDGYFLEYDSDRAGGFEPLRRVRKGKQQVVLGLVTSKSGRLERKDDIKRRIDEATKYVDLDQLCLSPQCGFASTEEGNILAEEEQWAKLRMIVELADEVWG